MCIYIHFNILRLKYFINRESKGRVANCRARRDILGKTYKLMDHLIYRYTYRNWQTHYEETLKSTTSDM